MSTQSPVSVIIRYLEGKQKGSTKKFVVNENLSITIGRGDSNNVPFSLDEDSISREHCVIHVKTGTPHTYEISDLQSKNGTFVNGQPVTGKTLLSAGDTITLGKNGPALGFTLDPLPAAQAPKTRLVDTPNATKVHIANTAAAAPAAKETIGKQTMQHMLQQSEKKSKKGLLVTAVSLLLLVLTAGWLIYSNRPATQVVNVIQEKKEEGIPSLTPTQINKENEKKVVLIEVGWKLELTSTGDQLYHVYLPDNNNGFVAAYIRNNTGVIEPYLATKGASPDGARLVPVGGFGSGSGFVVDERGFIITNRHVAAGWLTSYDFPQDAFPGVLVGNANEEPVPVYSQQVPNWVPADAMNYNRQMLESGVKFIDGVSAYLDVTFANNSLRTPAKVVRISNVHDVAMIKIELPESLGKVDMYDSKEIEPGNTVVVMGYPGLSPDQYVANRSQDGFNRNPNIVKVPVPTLSTGNIGRLVKGKTGSDKVDDYLNVLGDYYQLTVNSTGSGNSGGPTFDDQGRVIGIYSAGNDKVSYSIPIKYAIELMGRQEVIN